MRFEAFSFLLWLFVLGLLLFCVCLWVCRREGERESIMKNAFSASIFLRLPPKWKWKKLCTFQFTYGDFSSLILVYVMYMEIWAVVGAEPMRERERKS
jgi:hypothetical protein